MSGLRNEASPVSGSPDSDLRRLGEQLREFLRSDQFLAKLNVGPIIRAATGQIGALAWGTENRVQLSGDAILRLPPMDAAWIGKPLYMAKQTGTGIATVVASGGNSPTVNGSVTGVQFQSPGLHAFVTDGQGWYTEQASSTGSNVAPGVDTNSELFWNGAIWTPRYPRTAQHHDTTFSPVALYKLDGNLLDSSGNGLHLSVATGTIGYTPVSPGLTLGFFDNLTVLTEATKAAALRITGPLTIEALGSWRIYRPDVDTIISHAEQGETLSTNALYRWQLDTPFTTRYLHEHDAGVNETFDMANNQPPDLLLAHFALTRTASGIISFFANGRLCGTPTATGLPMPNGGTTGRLYIGGDGTNAAGSQPYNGNLGSVKILNTTLTQGQIVEEVNRTLGPILGFQ